MGNPFDSGDAEHAAAENKETRDDNSSSLGGTTYELTKVQGNPLDARMPGDHGVRQGTKRSIVIIGEVHTSSSSYDLEGWHLRAAAERSR